MYVRWNVHRMGVHAGQFERILYAHRSVLVRLDDFAAPISCHTLCCPVQPVRTDIMSSRDGGFESEPFLGLPRLMVVGLSRLQTHGISRPALILRSASRPALTGLSEKARHSVFCILYSVFCILPTAVVTRENSY